MNFTQSFLFYQDKELVFGPRQRKLLEFVREYTGPFYLYDLQFMEQRFCEMQEALQGAEVYYAMKANSHPEVLKALLKKGAGADVVSGGEILRALEVGFAPKQIVYSGVGKTRSEIELALKKGIAQINVESIPELIRIAKIARELNVQAPVAFRLNPDVSINTHPYIATGLRENKFGIELSQLKELKAVIEENRVNLKVLGISLHLGSQMHDFEALEIALNKLVPVYEEFKTLYPEVDVFDFGGGLGIFYDRQDLAEESQLLAKYAQVVERVLGGLDCRRQCEPGRWLVAHGGVLVSQVQYIKRTPYKTFVVIDTGMNHLLRPALYEAYHEIKTLSKHSSEETVDVVGPICESADFLGKDRKLYVPGEGDFIVIQDTGAYGASMASSYNLQELPREICF